MSTVSSSPNAVGVDVLCPEVGPAVGLGWTMAELYRAQIPTGPDADPDPPKRLPGMSNLRPRDRLVVGLLQVDGALSAIAGRPGFRWAAGVVPPTTSACRARLEATAAANSGPAEQRALGQAIAQLHVDLLAGLIASDENMGRAYGLGRALADTCRPGQTDEQLRASFRPGRIHEIMGWVVDLTSVLPAHAGHSVAASLSRWTQEVATGVAAAAPMGAIAAAPTAAPPDQTATSAISGVWPKSATSQPGRHPGPSHHHQLAIAVHRQGEMWRSLLTGQKHATDLLLPNDYVAAARQLAHRVTPLARKVARALWVPITVLAATAALVIVIAVAIRGSAPARLAATVFAAGGALGGSWRLVAPRATKLMQQVEEPLWGAELDAVIAEAVTLPPVGAGDPVGMLALAEAAVSDVVDLRDIQPMPAATKPTAPKAPAPGRSS